MNSNVALHSLFIFTVQKAQLLNKRYRVSLHNVNSHNADSHNAVLWKVSSPCIARCRLARPYALREIAFSSQNRIYIIKRIVCFFVCLPLPWPYLWTDFGTKGIYGLLMTQRWLEKYKNFDFRKKKFEKILKFFLS